MMWHHYFLFWVVLSKNTNVLETQFSGVRISSLLSAGGNLQLALGWFASDYKTLRIIISKSEAMVLHKKSVEWNLSGFKDKLLPKEFMYLLHEWGKKRARDWETDWWGICCNTDTALFCCGEERAGVESEAFSLWLILHLHPHLSHHLSVVTERIRLQHNFVQSMFMLMLRVRVLSLAIRGELKVQLVFLHIKRSQLKWLGQEAYWMSPKACPGGGLRTDLGHQGSRLLYLYL